MLANPALKELPENQLQNAVRLIVKSIAVISGCTIDRGMEQTTMRMVKNFLMLHFSFMTQDEILEAFTMNSVAGSERVQHYNRSLNCDYIGDVLNVYKTHRTEQMREIQKIHNQVLAELPPSATKEIIPVNDDDRKEVLEIAFDIFLKVPDMGFIEVERLYDYAAKFKLVQPDDYLGHVEKARAKLRGQIGMRIASISHEPRRIGEKKQLELELKELQNPNAELKETTLKVHQFAKELVIKDYFKVLQGEGKTTIFEPQTLKPAK